MNKKLLLFIMGLWCAAVSPVFGAVAIKKASSVAKQQTQATTSVASLVPTVLNLVQGVRSLTEQQKTLTEECVPTTQEITFVNNLMKEWARTGTSTAAELEKSLGRRPCESYDNGYEGSVRNAAGTESGDVCFERFAGTEDVGTVWEKFPKASKATYCKDGSVTCSNKEKVTSSDVYEIFGLITFTTADYTASESKTASTLIEKQSKCSPSTLSAKKRAAWGEFLVGTVSNLGQKTNTGSIMDAVGTITQSGGGLSSITSSLGGIATQFMGGQ